MIDSDWQFLYLQGNGHKEDILSVSVCPPNLLATSGYDGQIIVWNMISGHKFCQLREPELPNKEEDPCKFRRCFV